MSRWTVGWLLWLLWFVVEEYRALDHGGWQATLSGHVWLAFSIKDKGPYWRVRRLALLSFLAWLSLHMLTGGAF